MDNAEVLEGKRSFFQMTDIPPEAGRDRESLLAYGTKSDVVVPLFVGEGPVLDVDLCCYARREKLARGGREGFKLNRASVANALACKQMEKQLREHLQEIEDQTTVERENIYLREEVELSLSTTEIVGQSVARRRS